MYLDFSPGIIIPHMAGEQSVVVVANFDSPGSPSTVGGNGRAVTADAADGF